MSGQRRVSEGSFPGPSVPRHREIKQPLRSAMRPANGLSRRQRYRSPFVNLPDDVRNRLFSIIFPRGCMIIYTHFDRINAGWPAFTITPPYNPQMPYSLGLPNWYSFAVVDKATFAKASIYIMYANTLHMRDGYKAILPHYESFFAEGFKYLRSLHLTWEPWDSEFRMGWMQNYVIEVNAECVQSEYLKFWGMVQRSFQLESVRFTIIIDMPRRVIVPFAMDWIEPVRKVKTLKVVRFDWRFPLSFATWHPHWSQVGRGVRWDRDLMGRIRSEDAYLEDALLRGENFKMHQKFPRGHLPTEEDLEGRTPCIEVLDLGVGVFGRPDHL